MPTYGAPTVQFVRGEGCRAVGPRRQALPRLPRRLAVAAWATPTRRWPTPWPSRPAPCCTSPTCSAPSPAARWPSPSTACWAAAARCSSPTRAPRPTSAPSSWPASGAAAAGTWWSAPSARSTAAPWPPSTPPASPKHEAFQPLPEGFRHVAWDDLDALEAALDPIGGRRAARAGAGRGRRQPGHRRVLPGRAPAVRRARHPASWSTRCRPGSVAPGGGSATSTSASCPTWSPWPRRWATACPSAPAGPAARWPPRSSPATTPPPSAASPSPRPRPAPCWPSWSARTPRQLAEHAGIACASCSRRCPASWACGASACCWPLELADGIDARAVAAAALDAGLIVNAVTPTALRLAPPLLVSDAEIDEAVDRAGRRAGRRIVADGARSR